MREQRKQHQHSQHEVPLTGRRNPKCAPNSLKFMAIIEGEYVDGHVRGSNGMKWRVA